MEDEMDDKDNWKIRKIRAYSFSPSASPFRGGEIRAITQKFSNMREIDNANDDLCPYSQEWYEGKPYEYVKFEKFDFCKREHTSEIHQGVDIENLKMSDRPDTDGVDKHITIWWSWNTDVQPFYCENAKFWVSLVPHKFDYEKWKGSYQALLDQSDKVRDIAKDVDRTFQKHYAFRHVSMVHKLSKVLAAISVYDNELGYVQGMNFLAGALLIHWEESITFWLIVELLETYELREVYEDGFKGMYRQSAILESLIQKYLPEVSEHFKALGVEAHMFMSDWAISFLCSYIPLHRLNKFFTRFFQRGWVAFHWMVLAIINFIQKDILAADDDVGVLTSLKTMKEHRSSTVPDGRAINSKQMRLKDPFKIVDEEGSQSKGILSPQRDNIIEAEGSNCEEQWDEIFEMFEAYNKKIKGSEYIELFRNTKV